MGEPRPDRLQAAAALRGVFAGMYLAQVGMAAVLAVLILLLAGERSRDPSILGPVLAALSLAQVALGSFLAELISRPGSKGSVLSATLLAAVLLATPGWFLMLSLVTGQAELPLLVIAATLVAGYALGFAQSGRFARRASSTAGRAHMGPQG
jgi:hypothetical protein